MEVTEAIERIENRYMTVSMCINSAECKAENEAIDMAVSALGKQIPKKPFYEMSDISEMEGKPFSFCISCGEKIARNISYCPSCGQKIDWSVTE